MLNYSRTFEIENIGLFADVNIATIATELLVSKFLPRPHLPTSHRFVRIAKFLKKNHSPLASDASHTSVFIGTTDVDENGLLSAPNRFANLLLQTAPHYITNPCHPKGDLPENLFHSAAVHYLNVLSAPFTTIRECNSDRFKDGVLCEFLEGERNSQRIL